MLPSVVVVNDSKNSISYNPILTKLIYTLKPLVKVYLRSSVEGETLYNIREGVMYFDESGLRQRVWKDNYDSVVTEVEARLEKIPTESKPLLNKYQQSQQVEKLFHEP